MATIGSWILALDRIYQADKDCPIWPPDMFAICGGLLKRSGAYLRIFEKDGRDGHWQAAHRAGVKWRKAIDRHRTLDVPSLQSSLPADVKKQWTSVRRFDSVDVESAGGKRALCNALLFLALAADEASAGIGVSTGTDPFLMLSQDFLDLNDSQSFTWDIPKQNMAVLGKQHTPQRGATFRSLTHHLCLTPPGEIAARWVGPFSRGPTGVSSDAVNLLLLPWPEMVDSGDLCLADQPRGTTAASPYFDYAPTSVLTKAAFGRRLRDAVLKAKAHARQIDAIVLPELSLTIDQYLVAETIAVEAGAMLIAGVRMPPSRSQRAHNFCVLQPTGLMSRGKVPRKGSLESFRLVQTKHHRWCLDRAQMLQYQLSGSLAPADSVWENIELPPRALHFVTLGEWMTWSVIICEDLARQDPAADVIRSVGPNMLIALLMDGPQLQGRWPSRYASVLAEDPGTSVLTLTSLGMAERARPTLQATGRRADRSRAVALWRDIESGEHVIALDPNDNACVLTLTCASKRELAADGRSDGGHAHYPVFAGYHSFRAGK